MPPDDTPRFQTATLERTHAAPGDLTLKLAMADYDRVRPLIDGRVKPEGLALDITTDDIGQFCTRPVYEEFDVAEMSMSWYVAARARGEPCVALPVFPLRMAVLGYIYCHRDAPYKHPSELVGKRIASQAYRFTVNLWLRGMLEEHYGLPARSMKWVTCEPEGNAYVIPSDIDVTLRTDKTPFQLLMDGEIDAIMGPEAPPEFHAGDPRIRRLFPDARAEQAAYFRKTGIYPITHTVVMHQGQLERRPWLAKNLVDAFRQAQRVCDNYYYANPKHLSLPGAAFLLEEERRDYGPEPWSHGVAGNAHTVETFARYARAQNYVDRIIPVEEFFAEGTLEL